MTRPVEDDPDAWPENIYPNPEDLEIGFNYARRFNRFLGDAILERGGVDEATRIAGLRRETGRHRLIEIWAVRQGAALFCVHRGTNTYYFEIHRDEIPDEVDNLVTSGEWEVDYVRNSRLYNRLPDEVLPGDATRSPQWDF